MEETVTISLEKYDELVSNNKELKCDIKRLENLIDNSKTKIMVDTSNFFARDFYTMDKDKFLTEAIDKLKAMTVRQFKGWRKANT